MKNKRSKKFDVAKNMPPLHHSYFGTDFCITDSNVVKWLISQPEILQQIFDMVKAREIVFNPDTGKWQGVDYRD